MTAYDELGRRVSETNQDGYITRYGFDALGRLVAVTNDYQSAVASPFVTTYGYDEAGNQVSQTDANGHTTTFAYDKLGRRIRRTLPETEFELFFYDAAGNMTIHTNFDGRVTQFAYDVNNRLRTKRDPAAGQGALPLVELRYNITGQRATNYDASTPISYNSPTSINRYANQYDYDSRHRLITKTIYNGGQQSVPPPVVAASPYLLNRLNYQYDANGNVTRLYSILYPNGVPFTDLHFQWDALNRLTNVVNAIIFPNGNAAVGTSYTYDGVGNLEGFAYPNGVTTAYNYNTLNQLTDMAVTKGVGANLTTLATYNYNPADRPLMPSGTRKAARESTLVSGSLVNRSVDYEYDHLYRLNTETFGRGAGAPAVSYTYDNAGNRLRRDSTLGGVPARPLYVYDGDDRIMSYTDENSVAHNQPTDTKYDLNGNTRRGEKTPAQTLADRHDFDNRIIHRDASRKQIDLFYDVDGNRVRKEVTQNGVKTITYYLVDDM